MPVTSETKLTKSFPIGQFKVPGYNSVFRLDRDQHGEGIMVFIREDIPVKFFPTESKPIENLYTELKKKN